MRFSGLFYQGNHEPLVTEELWHKVQAQLARNRQGDKREQHNKHHLRGLLRCGECGDRISLTHSRGAGGTVYHYFFLSWSPEETIGMRDALSGR